ncbi:uncharacterized protein LOC113295237 [Papaver somniferum]|uniref:uncharacterized protein LOC113295237 n=1 Tax=Papaver somniferum TaxID=3469 RepID=UPI000E70569E|nr:uncharacterized protein LOC113295237 [Papaver somniferum]
MRNPPKRKPNYKFKFYWTDHPQFKDIIQDKWENSYGNMITRLDELGKRLMKWSKDTFRDTKREIDIEKKNLVDLQTNAHLDDTREKENAICQKIASLERRNRMFWRQRNKLKWIPSADKNTQVFHVSLIHRRSRNKIYFIKNADGEWTSEHDNIKNVLISHFNNMFSKDPNVNPSQEAISLVKDCFRYYSIPAGLNHTHISLIPKNKNVASAVNYRPIALCNVLYKVVAKIITNKLSPLLDNLIDKTHSAFISGRQILDNIVVAKEIFHSMHTSNSKQGVFALKLDMSKAYDRVDWNFLKHALNSFGITVRIHNLILSRVETTSSSILINGQFEGFFFGERGIRKGCPLSPYLFIIFSHILSSIINRMEQYGLYNGYQLNRRVPSVSHILFPDDVMLFGNTNETTINSIVEIMQQYYNGSGQLVNYSKSSIHFSMSVSDERCNEIITALGVTRMEKGDKYLGVNILQQGNTISNFSFLIDKFDEKLAGWKRISLTHAGRTTLIQVFLALIQVYYMATSVIPKAVGKGRNINIGTDPWIPSLPDCTLSSEVNDIAGVTKVHQFLDTTTGKWNLQLIQQLSDPFTASQISNIQINSKAKDKLIWHLTTHGDFSPQSFQKLIADQTGESSVHNDSSFPWRKFWNIKKNAPKIKKFIWRALHNGIGVFQIIGKFWMVCVLTVEGVMSVRKVLITFYCMNMFLQWGQPYVGHYGKPRMNWCLKISK